MWKLPPALAVVLLFLAALPARGQTGSDLMIRPFRETDLLELNADAAFMFGSETSNADAFGNSHDFRADIYDLTGRLRLTPGDSAEGIARAQPRAGFATRYIQLHSNDPVLPDELFDGAAALGMGVLSYEGWLGGISLGAGYAGTDFERDGNALYFQGSFAVGKTFANGVDSFGLVLDYDGNRSFLPDVPLLGFQYRRRLDPAARPPREGPSFEGYDPEADPARLVLALGFPFSGIEWRPNDRLTVEITYSIPQDLTARADYTLSGDPETGGVGLYASLNRTVSAFHDNDLPSGHRLFFRQSTAEAGLNWRLHDRLELVVAGGWAFNQEFETGWDSRDLDGVADVDDAAYVRALARLRL